MEQGSRTPSRSGLRLDDLKRRTPTASRLMNVKVPTLVFDQIGTLSERLGVSKTDLVVALLNEGLALARRRVRVHRT